MYRFTGKNANGDAVEPLPGLPLVAEDKVFDAFKPVFDAMNGAGAFDEVKKSGLYEHVSEKAQEG